MAEGPPVDDRVTWVLELTKPGWDEHAQRVRRYDLAYEVYRASRVSQRLQIPYAGKLRIPYAMFILDTALVNMVQDVPRAKVEPRAPGHEEHAQALQKLLDYYADRDQIRRKHARIVQSALIYGVGACKARWAFEQRPQVVRGEEGLEMRQVTVRDQPTVEPWDVYDIWWDPTAASVDEARWVALRSWLTAEEIMRLACSVEGEHSREECDGILHNAARLVELGPYGSTRPRTAQERILGKEQIARLRLYQLVEYWFDDRLLVVGNDQILLRDSENPHWHGRKPIAIASTRPDLHEIAGIPETELVDHLQQALWAVHNLRFENLLLTVQRMFTLRQSSPIDPKMIKLGPRAVIPVLDHDDLQPVPTQPLPAEAYNEESELLQRMQLVTGITPFVSGAAPLPGVSDQTTATGVSLLTDVASRLLRFKAEQIAYDVWKPVFEMWAADVQQFLTQEQWVRITGEDGRATFTLISPEQVRGEFDVNVDASSVTVSRQQQRSELVALLNVLAPFLQVINPTELVKRIAKAFDVENPGSLLPQQPLPASPLPGGQGPPSSPLPESQPPGASQTPQLDPRLLQELTALVRRR
jgi:hypothetical protein